MHINRQRWRWNTTYTLRVSLQMNTKQAKAIPTAIGPNLDQVGRQRFSMKTRNPVSLIIFAGSNRKFLDVEAEYEEESGQQPVLLILILILISNYHPFWIIQIYNEVQLPYLWSNIAQEDDVVTDPSTPKNGKQGQGHFDQIVQSITFGSEG